MKFIITESQVYNMFFKRRIPRIKELVTEKMMYYPPCDYTYDPYFAWHDYYGDVRNGVIHEIVSDLGLEWDSDDSIKKIEDLSESMDKWMYERFYDKVREYYDKVLSKGCEEDY
jgi:hypothetical protein